MEIHDVDINQFVHDGIAFWYNANNHVRCPFPDAIRETLEQQTTNSFSEMLLELDQTKQIELSELVEMLEVLMFNEAVKLVEDEDQQLTIMYPFLPRIGDIVNDEKNGKGEITERKSIVSKENKKSLEVTILSTTSKATWKTEFELPA